MPQTANQAAVQAAYDITNIMLLMRTLREQCKSFNDKYNSEAYNTLWNNMTTATQNADGTIGATDGSPNTAHPIIEGNIWRSATKLIAGVTALQQFLNFVGNSAVTTGNYSQNIDDLTS